MLTVTGRAASLCVMFLRITTKAPGFSGLLLAGALLGVACARTPPASAPEPASVPRKPPRAVPTPVRSGINKAVLPQANPNLPPVPQADGPLAIRVVYPTRGALIASRDSNFIFGTVGSGEAGLTINGELVPVWPNGAFLGWIPNPPAQSQWYDLEAYTATDTAKLRYPVRTRAGLALEGPRPPTKPEITRFDPAVDATLRNDSLDRAVSDTDNIIIGRPTPTGDYKWFLLPGTPVRLLEYRDNMARVQLDPGQDIWVAKTEIKPSASRAPIRPLNVTSARVHPSEATVDIEVHVASPPAYVIVEGERDLTLTLYNTTTGATFEPPRDSLVDSASQSTDATRTVYHFALSRPLYGYQVTYRDGVFTLAIRRPPSVDAAEPLRGMTIVVDPGHPPIGATGPTGLWEPVATLAVGLRIEQLLKARGAHVVMTRTNADPVGLGDRPIVARRANANAFISIHLNAVADGQNPFRDNGTGTYYFHPQSKLFAQTMQDALVPALGLHSRGVFYQNLAVCRPTWFPSVLAEGLFIIMPDQEAAIRTPEYQEAYARGIVDGLEKYFATFVH